MATPRRERYKARVRAETDERSRTVIARQIVEAQRAIAEKKAADREARKAAKRR